MLCFQLVILNIRNLEDFLCIPEIQRESRMTIIYWILPKPSAESRQKTNIQFTVLQNNKTHWITAFHVNKTHRVLDSSSSDLSLSPLLSPRHLT